MSNLNIDQLSKITFDDTPESASKLTHNKEVLHTFAARTSSNLLGIIEANGNQLNRVGDKAWLAHWYAYPNPDLVPVLNTLAITFNTALAACQQDIARFHASLGDDDFVKAHKSLGEVKKMLSEMELIKDSYLYRYGNVPGQNAQNLNQAIQNAIPWTYRRNPKITYAPQNAVLSTLDALCAGYRRSVEDTATAWNRDVLVPSIHAKPEGFPELISDDPFLNKNKNFMVAVLQGPQQGPQFDKDTKIKLFNLCDPSLQGDFEIQQAAGFISPSTSPREVPAEVQRQVSETNREQLGKDFNFIGDVKAYTAYTKGEQKHPQEGDQKQ